MSTGNKTEVNFDNFTAGMQGFVDKLGVSGPVVMKKEMGELVKTLVRITPASQTNKIQQEVFNRFTVLAHNSVTFNSVKAGIGPSGIKWYRWNSGGLYGAEPDQDKTDASVEDLRALYYSTRVSMTRSDGSTVTGGRAYRVLDFKHPRKTQKVFLAAKYLIKRATATKLAQKIARSRGRLKAGWMAAVFGGALDLTGGNLPPQWVTRHRAGVAGYFVNGLGNKTFPSFTIANTAAGVGNPKNNLNALVRTALAIRSKAMATNLRQFMAGKKHLGDYAK